jgi:hypothetical protein
MCFSQYAQYVPRPVVQKEYEYEAPTRPEGAPPTKADLDENLFGPKPLPPQWQKKTGSEGNGHSHSHVHNTGPAQPAAAVHVAGAQNGNGAAAVTSVTTQTVEAVVVELSNGTKLLICPL